MKRSYIGKRRSGLGDDSNSLLCRSASTIWVPLAEVGQVLCSSKVLVEQALVNFVGCHFGLSLDGDHRRRRNQIQM